MNNIVPHSFNVERKERNHLNDHKSLVIWFTGLSGSGKSTIANKVEQLFFKNKIRTFSLDGDNIRGGINKDLGFSKEDRQENLRRIAEVAKLFVNSGQVVIASFISPLKEDRLLVKSVLGENDFYEVFVNTSLEECERRDVKGLYKKARAGEIANFTGISAPYESPVNPELEIKTEEESIEESVNRVFLHFSKKLKLNNE